ncbi:Cyclin-dependent kinase [Diaporthe eres]
MHSELVPLLLERQDPIPISKIKTTGWQSLHWAARYGRLDIVRLMVTQGADVFAKDSEGHLPADIARHTKPESIEMLEWLSPPKVDVYEDQHLAPDLTRPRADIAVNDMCKNALVHVVGLYPTCVIQKSEFSVYNFLYEYGPERIMTAVSAAKRIDEPLDFRWVHLPANNENIDTDEDDAEPTQPSPNDAASETGNEEGELLRIPYLNFTKLKDLDDLKSPEAGCHLPLTLDQYYYHSMPGTEGRAKDQVLFRHQETVSERESADAMDPNEDARDLRQAINDHMVQEKDRLPPQAEVAEVRLFDEFETHLQSYDNPLPKDKRQFNGGILPEIKLLKEIKDVLDELSIIETVFRSQRLVIQDAINFFRRMHSLDSDFAEFGNYYEAFSKLDVAVTELDKLKDAAKQTHANVSLHGLNPAESTTNQFHRSTIY